MIYLVLPHQGCGGMMAFGYQHHWPELRRLIMPHERSIPMADITQLRRIHLDALACGSLPVI